MEAAGFVDVHEEISKIPIGTWPKRKELKKIGAFESINMVEGIEGLSLRLLGKVLGMPSAEVQILLMNITNLLSEELFYSWLLFQNSTMVCRRKLARGGEKRQGDRHEGERFHTQAAGNGSFLHVHNQLVKTRTKSFADIELSPTHRNFADPEEYAQPVPCDHELSDISSAA